MCVITRLKGAYYMHYARASVLCIALIPERDALRGVIRTRNVSFRRGSFSSFLPDELARLSRSSEQLYN